MDRPTKGRNMNIGTKFDSRYGRGSDGRPHHLMRSLCHRSHVQYVTAFGKTLADRLSHRGCPLPQGRGASGSSSPSA